MRRQLPHDEGKPDEGELSEGKVEGKKSVWIRKIYIIKSDRRPFPAAKKANILAD